MSEPERPEPDPSEIPDTQALEQMLAPGDPERERSAAAAEDQTLRRLAREAGRPAPLPLPSQDRLISVLQARGVTPDVDEDGDLYAVIEGHTFYVFLFGPLRTLVEVRGLWGNAVSEERQLELALAVNDWNRDRYWPKAYTHRREDSGDLLLRGEVAVDFESGVTDEQLDQLIICGVQTCLDLFQEFDSRFGPQDDDSDDDSAPPDQG